MSVLVLGYSSRVCEVDGSALLTSTRFLILAFNL